MTFAKEVDTFISNAKLRTDEEFGKQVLALQNDIMVGTPVDEGVLKNNWQLGESLNNDKLDADKSGAEVRARAVMAARALTINDTAIIFNNMEYAEAIERGLGNGTRIPARMVQLAIAMAQARNGF